MTKKTWFPWVLLFVLALIWGSSFILMKKGLFNDAGLPLFSSVQLASLRLTIAGVVLMPISLKHLFRFKGKTLIYLILVAIFGNVIPAFMFAIAQSKLDSGYVGMLNSLTPIFTFFVAVVAFKQKSRLVQFIGLALGLIGTIGLISLSVTHGEFNWKYSFLVMIASSCYAISVNVIHVKLKELSSISIAATALLLAAIPGALYLLFGTHLKPVLEIDQAQRGLLFIGILSVLGTAFALVLFNKLVQLTNAVTASSVTYIIPLVAVFWGIRDGEQLSWMHVFYGAIILLGVYLVNQKKV